MRFALLSALLLTRIVAAETPAPESGPTLRLTAVTANVTGAPDSVRIDVFRWSTDAERDSLMAAWELKPGAAISDRLPGRGGEGGRGGGRGARGGTARGPAATPGAASGADEASAAAPARGRGAARSGVSAAAPSPEGQLALALKEAPTIGYLWSSEAAGYAVRYAGKTALPDGADRIILITDRRLGEANGLWRAPAQTGPAPYDFSIIELHLNEKGLNAKGSGEGKLSLREKIVADAAAGIVTLANYDSLPVVFTGLKRATK
jgi:hypothetical protein